MAAPAAHGACLDLVSDSSAAAAWIVAAVVPELADAPGGSAVEVRAVGEHVRVDIQAVSLADLRAALNNVVRLLDAAHEVASRLG